MSLRLIKPVTNEFGCQIVYIDQSRAMIKNVETKLYSKAEIDFFSNVKQHTINFSNAFSKLFRCSSCDSISAFMSINGIGMAEADVMMRIRFPLSISLLTSVFTRSRNFFCHPNALQVSQDGRAKSTSYQEIHQLRRRPISGIGQLAC